MDAKCSKLQDKLRQLVTLYKEQREALAEHEEAGETREHEFRQAQEAASLAAESAAADLRRERDAVKEELEAVRSVITAADEKVLGLTEELASLQRDKERLEAAGVALRLQLAAGKMTALAAGTGKVGTSGNYGARRALDRWKRVNADGTRERLAEEVRSQQDKASSYEVRRLGVQQPRWITVCT